jgi:acyl carrier protein
MAIQQRVKQFIVENFYISDPAELKEDTSLIEGGYVDSTGMLELIAFLESEYGFRVEETETVPENLGSVGQIAAYVARKKPSAAN